MSEAGFSGALLYQQMDLLHEKNVDLVKVKIAELEETRKSMEKLKEELQEKIDEMEMRTALAEAKVTLHDYTLEEMKVFSPSLLLC